MLRLIVKAFLAGLAFGAGLILFLWVSAQLSAPDISDFHVERIASTESKLGATCLETYQTARDFIKSDVSKIIEAGLAGQDWASLVSGKEKNIINSHARRLYDCNLIDYHAKELGYEWPDFMPLHNLLTSLNIYAGSYSGKPLTPKQINSPLFTSLVSEYKNVTSQWCIAQQAGLDSQSCASAAAH